MSAAMGFMNYSDETFIHYWNKEEYVFPPKEKMILPDYLHKHFSKHLAVRELYKRLGKDAIINPLMIDIEAKKTIAGSSFQETSAEKLEVAMLNAEAEALQENMKKEEVIKESTRFCEHCDSKGVRHKKECPTLIKPNDHEQGANAAVSS